ncbi:hypothetical protein GCM10023323_22170 [Streptomyces thinghirensis]|uniref:Uncharacterized protein n=1 Tax=Streptomyces thinghirensis TaxID=551547 RepID=A0ABP9T2Q5_9ACTN
MRSVLPRLQAHIVAADVLRGLPPDQKADTAVAGRHQPVSRSRRSTGPSARLQRDRRQLEDGQRGTIVALDLTEPGPSQPVPPGPYDLLLRPSDPVHAPGGTTAFPALCEFAGSIGTHTVATDTALPVGYQEP